LNRLQFNLIQRFQILVLTLCFPLSSIIRKETLYYSNNFAQFRIDTREKGMNMKPLKKLHLVQFLLLFNLILGSSTLHHNHTNYYGNVKTQPPFLTSNFSISSQLRITVNVPTHAPEFCKGCENPNGNCNAGLKCLCHLKECSKPRSLICMKFLFYFV